MSNLPEPGQQFGRYRLLREIGRGGMGSVFEAEQPDLARRVAIKLLRVDLGGDAGFRARFVREARLLAGMDSPHIIQLYDFGEHDGRLYMVTQLVRGGDLQARLQGTDGLARSEAIRLLSQVAAGLETAHASGLLHRDIKPSNVLLRAGEEIHAYLCDFGIARSTAATHTATTGVLGTVGYMAPERHEGAPASIASDVYSLGCLLWAALTGQAPYSASTDVGVALQHMQAPLPQLDGSGGSAAINEIFRRSLAKDPSARYQSAREMRAALERVSDHDAPPPSSDLATTVVTAASSRDATVLRSPAPGPAAAFNLRARRRGRRRLAVSAAVAATMVATTATAAVLLGLGGGGDERVEGARAPSAITPTGVSPPPTSVEISPSARPARQPSAKPSARQSAVMVRCWNGTRVTVAGACSLPRGRKGMASVFPSLDTQCRRARSARIAEKAEVYNCDYGDYMIRYTRWNTAAQWTAYYDEANPGAVRSPWRLDNTDAGTQWFSYEAGVESKPYQWSAAYRTRPFSVSVEGINETARRIGLRRVEAIPASNVGLAS